MDCGGTARCGVYPKKRINTVNLVPVGAVGPLAQYITEDIYVSDVKEDTIAFTDEEVKVEKAVEETKEPGAPKTKAQARKELAEANQGKKPGIITRIGIGVGQVVNKFFAAGRESIEMVTQVVGTLLGAEIGLGNIPAQYALPALFAINAQVGGDFVPVGLSLGEAEPETIEFGVPAVLYSRVITGPLAVIIAFVFSIGMY